MTIRSCTSLLLSVVIGLICVTQAVGQRLCRPALRINDAQFSPMQPPTLERTWSAVVSVDASQCAADSSGSFEIVFLNRARFRIPRALPVDAACRESQERERFKAEVKALLPISSDGSIQYDVGTVAVEGHVRIDASQKPS
jgi:hypothetical protein